MAAVKLTRDYIRNLAARQTTYEVRDSDCVGLVLRVHPTGRMVFVCEFARGRRTNIGRADVMPPAEARERARQIIADFGRGIDPVQARGGAKTTTFRAFIDGDYGEWARAHYRDGDATVARLRATFPDFLDLPLDEITPWHVDKWRAKCKQSGTKATTLNRQLNPLKAMLKRAVEWGVIGENRLSGFARLERVDAVPKVRFLSDDEEMRLRAQLRSRDAWMRARRVSANEWRADRGYRPLDALPEGHADHLEPLVLLSLNTGLRLGEALNLEWGDLDLEAKLLTVRGEGAKSLQTRHIPLNSEAIAVLRAWRGNDAAAGYAFPNEAGRRLTSVRTSWRRVLVDAAISDFRWHDLRHTFASRLVMNGVDLNTVRELLGHADMKMTIRYAHLAPHVKADAVARLVRPA